MESTLPMLQARVEVLEAQLLKERAANQTAMQELAELNFNLAKGDPNARYVYDLAQGRAALLAFAKWVKDFFTNDSSGLAIHMCDQTERVLQQAGPDSHYIVQLQQRIAELEEQLATCKLDQARAEFLATCRTHDLEKEKADSQAALIELRGAAQRVADNWEQGDLAGAVTDLITEAELD